MGGKRAWSKGRTRMILILELKFGYQVGVKRIKWVKYSRE